MLSERDEVIARLHDAIAQTANVFTNLFTSRGTLNPAWASCEEDRELEDISNRCFTSLR